jgi:heat shock protein 5
MVELERLSAAMGRRSLLRTLIAAAAIIVIAAGVDEKPPPLGTVIGIDLGTTYSCVGVFTNGRVEIIPNDQGNRITPSYVAWDAATGERLIGDAAKNQATVSPETTVFDAKRLIGRMFSDSQVQADRKMFPFKVVSQEGRPFILVTVKGVAQTYSPEEISAMVLNKMRSVAEGFIGGTVEHAVVTVPAYFNDAQRQATKDAGTIAGLNVQRIINEPTAAAIAYGIDKKGGERKILVFDLGGGTFDVTLLSIDGGVFEVLATNGDTHLGGEDFDQRVMQYFIGVMKKRGGALGDITKDKRAMQKLRREVERVKRALSSQPQARLEIESLHNGEDFSETLTRARFEELNMDLFKRTLRPVEMVLEDGDVGAAEVDELVLVGGSTRIPKVRELLKQMFDGKEPSEGVNPDEAVAYGAAVQGGIMSGEATEETKDLLLLDVTPLTLGKEVIGGVMAKMIPRNTVIPVKKSKSFTTTQDMQTTLNIRVFEGERSMVADNHLIGEFKLTGLLPAPKGVPSVEVTFEIDANGILQVTAVDQATKKTEKITITAEKGRLSEEEISRMVREAEEHAEEDRLVKEKTDAKYALESYVYGLKAQFEDLEESTGAELAEEDREELEEAIAAAVAWLDENADAEYAEDYKEKQREVEDVANPLIKELYSMSSGQQQKKGAGGGGRRGGSGGGGGRRRPAEEAWEDDPDL